MIPIETRNKLIAEIAKAFAGVTLEDGVGLKEADAIDEYADNAMRQQYRQEDEKYEWSAIPPEKLERYHGSPAFFDPKGMRFHLPAFLIAQLNGKSIDMNGYLCAFWLELKEAHLNINFCLLSAQQRAAVCHFLYAVLEDPDEDYYAIEIQKAINEFWGK
jgi:hypothetical protein